MVKTSCSYLGHPVSAPAGLEPVVLPLDLDVGALAVDRVRCAQVVEGGQKVEPAFSLKNNRSFSKGRRNLMDLVYLSIYKAEPCS